MVCSLWSYKRLAQGLLAFLGMVLLLALGACSMPTAQPKDSASKLIATNPAANPAADPAVDLTGNPRIAAVLAQPPHVLLLGEQHDAPDHPALHADVVQRLIASGQLAALVLEMADTGKDTRAVPKTGADADVQAALAWNTQAWDWSRYAPSVLAAVRAGVPVLGANLPRSAMDSAMKNSAARAMFTQANWQKQLQNIRTGHCDMLPETQIEPMVRVQVARDASMARALAAHVQTAKTVVLIAGAFHTDEALGVPAQLKNSHPGVSVQSIRWPEADTGKDYCAEFRQQMPQKPQKPQKPKP